MLENGFSFGLVGQVYYHNKSKAIIWAYDEMKGVESETLANLFLKTTNKCSLNVVRMVGLVLLEKENVFPLLFEKEVCSIEQLLLFWQVIHLTNSTIPRLAKDLIKKWLVKNLTEKMAMSHRDVLKNIFEKIGFKPRLWHGKRLCVLREFVVNEKNCLPRQKTIKKIQREMRHSGLSSSLLTEMTLAEVELSEIVNYMSGLLPEEAEEIVAHCLPLSPLSDIRLLERVFPSGTPPLIEMEKDSLLSKASYYECLSAGAVCTKSTPNKAFPRFKIFIDSSHSMRQHEDAVRGFVGYVQNEMETGGIFFVGNEVRPYSPESLSGMPYEKGCNFNLALMLLADKDTFLFVTDGNVDLLEMEKRFRSCRKDARLIVWFLGRHNDKRPHVKNIFYFFGEPDEIHQQLIAFAVMEGRHDQKDNGQEAFQNQGARD